MRILLASLAILSAVSFTGCLERQNMRAVPNRESRAGGDGSQKLGDMANAPVAGRNETWYTLEGADTLYTVAKKFNVTTEWLIKRNEILDKSAIKAGKSLIVPSSK
jgi:hypothetical protein